jgi:hypothetical protein
MPSQHPGDSAGQDVIAGSVTVTVVPPPGGHSA